MTRFSPFPQFKDNGWQNNDTGIWNAFCNCLEAIKDNFNLLHQIKKNVRVNGDWP